jgi:hypothetical protein
MKKLLLLSLLTGVLPFSKLSAQESKVDRIFKTYRFGLFVSPTFNSLRPTSGTYEYYNVTKGEGNVGFSFGLVADYNINERYTVFSGLGLDWRGGGINAQFDTSRVLSPDYVSKANVTYKHQYLTIPLGLKMMATQVDNFKIYAQTGIDLALLLSNRGKVDMLKQDGTTLVNTSTVNLNQESIAKAVPINLGWQIGPGIEYDINGKNAVFLTLLYHNGFTDATRPQGNKSKFKFSDGNIRSNSFMIRFGYFF